MQLSDFPIFLHFGNVNVHIIVNVDTIKLNNNKFKQLEEFHNKLFLDVLGVKDFVVRNYDNENNSYLLVPISFSGLILNLNENMSTYSYMVLYYLGNEYNIDWNVVDVDKFIETEIPTMEQRKSKFYNKYLQTFNVISPWYRNIVPIQVLL